MKYKYFKSKNNLKNFFSFELRYIFYKSLFFNLNLSNKIRQFFYIKLIKKKKKSFFSIFKAHCFFTYNSRFLINHCRLSRFRFKFLNSFGLLNGFFKN